MNLRQRLGFLALVSGTVGLLAPAGAFAQTSAPPGYPDAPPPGPPPPPRAELHVAADPGAENVLAERESDGFGAFGLRVSLTGARRETLGLSFAGHLGTYVDSGNGTGRVMMFWNLGGGGAGFEGAFGGSFAGGVRARLDPVQSLVFRVGLEGYVLGDDFLYSSALEFPQGQAGYQFFDRSTLFEVGAKTGAVLTGRFRDPSTNAERKYPVSVEWGGYASLSLAPVRFDASFTRIEDRGDALATPIDLLEGTGCGFVSKLAFCADGRWQRGVLLDPAGKRPELSSFYGGVLFGFGFRDDGTLRHRRVPGPPPRQPPPLQAPPIEPPPPGEASR